MPRPTLLAVLSAFASVTLVTSCAQSLPPPPPLPVAAAPAPPLGPDPARFRVLMINGGGSPEINYQPHLLHIRAMRDTLLASGIKPEQITVFSSDGEDPAPDLVSRDAQPESDFWLLRDTRLEHPLETPRRFVSSELPGVVLHSATKGALKTWFDEQAHVLQPGDTLLLYVTDHGNRPTPDPATNTIQLWGRDQQLSVLELRELLNELPAGVRVVSVMSQCFSGGFAGLSQVASSSPNEARRAVCGFFSSTEDRPAYGCFPENVGKERVGHSFHFIRALAATRRFGDAQAEVLAGDDTPDVPLRTSDVYLDALLHGAATRLSTKPEALADELLGTAWRDEPAWQSERALVDRIAGAFGLRSPASFDDLKKQYDEVALLGHRLEIAARAWKGATSDATGDNLQAFLTSHPTWNERVSDGALKALTGDGARALTAKLLEELAPWTRKDKGDRLDTLEHRSVLAEEASYRTEVRIAAMLRLRAVLTSLAGRAYLDRFGTPGQRDEYAGLRACEDVTLPAPPPSAPAPASVATASVAPLESPPPFPAIADDEKVEREIHPAWIGIGFGALRDDVRNERGLPSGTSMITGVVPDSPAKAAGLQPGDLVLGPPGNPFTAHNQVRAWTMLSPPGQPETLTIARGDKKLDVTIVPRAFPDEMPAGAPNGPEVGTPAPALNLRTYRGGNVRLGDGKPHLLLFWATWCKPCKASLPEALAYARAHHTPIVAITDEPKGTLDEFFKTWKQPFPATVAIDDLRAAFVAYGISATPGFVLVDGKGIVRTRAIGYSSPPGLPIDGWKWSGSSRP